MITNGNELVSLSKFFSEAIVEVNDASNVPMIALNSSKLLAKIDNWAHNIPCNQFCCCRLCTDNPLFELFFEFSHREEYRCFVQSEEPMTKVLRNPQDYNDKPTLEEVIRSRFG